MKKYLSANEMLEAVNTQWATVADIMKIGSVGINKAREIKSDIERQIIDSGFILPQRRVVPMQNVINYFNIDIDFLKRVSIASERR